jgi:hypothetical protein
MTSGAGEMHRRADAGREATPVPVRRPRPAGAHRHACCSNLPSEAGSSRIAAQQFADDREEAAQTTAALDALDAVLAGAGDVDAFFADLVEREPQLPRT